MLNIVTCLRLLENNQSQDVLARKLNLTQLEVLELIGKINHIEANLINTNSYLNLSLTRKLDWLNPLEITRLLQEYYLLNEYQLILFDQLNSTNSYILDNLATLSDKSIITTEYQMTGRGRFDRQWKSSLVGDLTVSILYYLPLAVEFEVLPLIIAVAVHRFFKEFKKDTWIKWPNDIYLKTSGYLDNDNKVAGILVESGVRNNLRYIVIGIGVNNVFVFKRDSLFACLIKQVDLVIKEYLKLGFTNLLNYWLSNCVHYNKLIDIYQNGQLIDSGMNSGLSTNGKLVINSVKFGLKEYQASNISIRF